MWKLQAPDSDPDQLKSDLSDALTLKNGTPVYPISNAEKNNVLTVYGRYDALNGEPHTDLEALHLGNPLLSAIEDAYNEVQMNRRLSDLRDRLLLSATICPYCGFGEVTDLDHHLPKSRYKGLAIYPNNLVPCCGPCNGKKRAVAGAAATSQFHHTYLGTLPDDVFFVAQADLSSDALNVTFEIRQVTGMSDETFQRLTYQVQRLELNDRYQEQINVYIGSLSSSLIEAYGEMNDAVLVRAFLERSAENNAEIFGKNDWRPVLLRALSVCDAFCAGGFKKALGQVVAGA